MEKKKIFLSIAIALVFVFFIGYGIEVFDKSENYEQFCPNVYEQRNQTACESAGGIWEENQMGAVPAEATPVKSGYCQNKIECSREYEQERARHEKIIFIVSVIVGLLAVVMGIILEKDSVSIGILGGGILSIFYGTIRYWNQADDMLKFIILGIVLVILIWLAYKKFDKNKK